MQASLNFLSPDKKAQLRAGFVLAYVQTTLLLLCIVVAAASGVLFALRMFVAGMYEEVNARIEKTSDDSKTVGAEVDKMNAYLGRIDRYEKRFVPWSTVIAAISSSVPEGVTLSNMLITGDGGIQLSGKALTRDQFLSFQDALKKNPKWKNVSTPLSNLLKENDVTFQLSLSYADMPAIAQEGINSAPRGRKK